MLTDVFVICIYKVSETNHVLIEAKFESGYYR